MELRLQGMLAWAMFAVFWITVNRWYIPIIRSTRKRSAMNGSIDTLIWIYNLGIA